MLAAFCLILGINKADWEMERLKVTNSCKKKKRRPSALLAIHVFWLSDFLSRNFGPKVSGLTCYTLYDQLNNQNANIVLFCTDFMYSFYLVNPISFFRELPDYCVKCVVAWIVMEHAEFKHLLWVVFGFAMSEGSCRNCGLYGAYLILGEIARFIGHLCRLFSIGVSRAEMPAADQQTSNQPAEQDRVIEQLGDLGLSHRRSNEKKIFE